MNLRFAAACLSLPALLLTACGGGDSQDGSSPASSSAATSSATASTASSARSSTSAASSSAASAASASSASSASASSVSSSASSAASQSSSSTAIFTVSPASLTLTESTSSAAFYLASENMAFESAAPARCYALTGGSSQTVISGDNTITWASAGTSLADQKQIASYAEAAVQTIKTRLGLTAATVGMDGNRVRICADSGLTIGDGSAGYRSFIVATLSSPLNNGKTQSARDELTADDNSGLKRLVLHEMTHVAQAQLLKCQSSSPAFERWYLEGMALRVAGQDQPYVAELASLQTAFNSSTPTPFDDTNNTANANFDRYMAYRLAVDPLLGETGRNESDLFGFLRQYGQQNGCPSGGTGNFLNAFDSYFGTSLRESGSTLGGRFWADAAPRYALP